MANTRYGSLATNHAISNSSWIVSIVHNADENDKTNAFLLVEGMDQDQHVMRYYELVAVESKILIKPEFNLANIPNDHLYHLSIDITRNQADSLHKLITENQTAIENKTDKHLYRINLYSDRSSSRSIFSSLKDMSNRADFDFHRTLSSFGWAIGMLCELRPVNEFPTTIEELKKVAVEVKSKSSCSIQ